MPDQIPALMKAAVLVDGQPNLAVEQIPVPMPQAGEALVRVRSCGVCHTDLHVIRGEVTFPRPAVMGHEISGTVVGFGDGTKDQRGMSVGDDVIGAFVMPCTACVQCLRGRDDLCVDFFAKNRLDGTLYDGESRLRRADGSFLAMYSMGGLAEYSVVPISALAPLPAGIDPVPSAILGCAVFTAYGAVHRAGRVRPGESVAVIAAGGVGSALVQIAKAAGADPVIAIDVADAKLAAVAELGATHMVNSRRVDVRDAIRTAVGGTGVDVAFEALGHPQTFQQATTILADGGRVVVVGIAAGTATGELEITPLVRRGYSVSGSFGARTREDLPAVIEIARTGQVDVERLVTQRFGLDDVDEAYQQLAHGVITGRAVIAME